MPREASKATITEFTGTGAVRVVDDVAGTGVSRLMSPADLLDEMGGAPGGGSGTVTSVNGDAGPAVVLDADDIDDAATTNKFVTQAQVDRINGFTPQTVTGTTDTLDAGDDQVFKRYTDNALVTITIPDLAVGTEGYLAASGTAGITVTAPSYGTIDGVASVGQGSGLYWLVFETEVLMLRGGEVVEGGGDVLAANQGSEYDPALFRANINVDPAGYADDQIAAYDVGGVFAGRTMSTLLDGDDRTSIVEERQLATFTKAIYSAGWPSRASLNLVAGASVWWINFTDDTPPTEDVAGDLVLLNEA